MPQTVNDASGQRSSSAVLIATSLTLFSMFFGAGNLIFPPIMGASAGTNVAPAMTGFLIGGVALPVISIITIALSGTDMRDLVNRAGKSFGLVFSVMVYLSIGAFYALPRTGAVSFSTAVAPIIGTKSLTASILFSLVFFGVAFYLCWNPGTIIDSLGKVLTPILLGLLVLLVFLCLASLPASHDAPTGEYSATPLAAGLLEGYMTMDSIAALAFGIIVVTSLGHTGGGIGAKVVRRTSTAAIIAGSLLAVVYVGLGLIGHVIPNAQSYGDGATLLADAAQMTMGWPGQIVFGLIVLTACMTTAVGLITATSEFFHRLRPAISYRTWMIVFTIISFALASAGLDSVLAIAVPIITFLYPIAITVVFITIATHPLRLTTPALWTFRLGSWMAAAWSAATTLAHVGVATEGISSVLMWSPLQANQLGWILPTLIAALIGACIDVAAMRHTAA
ncbi:branched-chain amino acid transport system II carrier protein [Actinomyces sp. oral taxon 180]|uniref:branched-chain amino acid transport system II carrier protein n=1 Tax=Actinomyces sp. oral taxon 180 TaxID=651609 RepID=UPI0001F15332|nr:branched-chain amino acid transport system II carrier protein [Actinomyces sp. oral taxon 180]EFU61999.1 LIVCS family branched chain amino acid:cation symporter [Actinomyces sp. oral taxon 180 str. F0310]